MRAVAARTTCSAASPPQQGLPFLSREEMPSALPVLKNLSPKYLRQYVACPIAVDGAIVTLATADPTNPLLLDDLRQSLGPHRPALRGAGARHPGRHRAHLRGAPPRSRRSSTASSPA